MRVLEQLTEWASANDDVRAMLLTSTRAIGGAVDAYSDYDIILVLSDVTAYAEKSDWLSAFGELAIAYWDPIETDPRTGESSTSNITYYTGGLDIDFTLWPVSRLARLADQRKLPTELDAGYRVLVDKDGVAARLPAPTLRGYIPDPPDEATFLRLITDFFIGPPHVAKCLLRGDLVIAKWILDFDMRSNYLQPMLDWWVECGRDWNHKPGNLGKGIQRVLPDDLWHDVRDTYVGPGLEENWEAMFSMMRIFGRLGRDVARSLGYRYPDDLDHRVTRLVRRMRAGDFAAGPHA
jgi:aminoglycoside 6-adenylyltransferase